jgi:hypothetical protein
MNCYTYINKYILGVGGLQPDLPIQIATFSVDQHREVYVVDTATTFPGSPGYVEV